MDTNALDKFLKNLVVLSGGALLKKPTGKLSHNGRNVGYTVGVVSDKSPLKIADKIKHDLGGRSLFYLETFGVSPHVKGKYSVRVAYL